MTFSLRLTGLSLLACTLACQAIAGIDPERTELFASEEQCRDYCKVVNTKCSGDSAVYPDQDLCMSACRKLPASGDATNSVECRVKTVRSSGAEPADCAAAGPAGAGLCGTSCENYCWLMSQACAADDYRDYWLGDLEACNAACQGLHDLGNDEGIEIRYFARDDNARDHWGDTVQCRVFHAVVASASPTAAEGHCWHAALIPRPHPVHGHRNPCISEEHKTKPDCKDYCRLVMVACKDEQKVYESEDQCNLGCEAAFDAGDVLDARSQKTPEKKNTLGCRYTHAYNALVSPPTTAGAHCGHASPSGDSMCGSPCESYCDQLFKTCQTQAKETKDRRDPAQCLSTCEAEARKPEPYSLRLARSDSNPLACRLYALTEARASAGNPEGLKTKCEVAAGKRACP